MTGVEDQRLLLRSVLSQSRYSAAEKGLRVAATVAVEIFLC